ncbi:unnamed protein product [Mytilus edulis]|uniref:Uncharacterized protein n=1 Tax=Mytilus edulis TaxID=6550 RepID=A0A8S3VIJ8_MYTED|nr:unnamed protein product [Mytilus edulis]
MTQSSYKSLLQLSSAVFRLVCKAYPSIDSDSKQKMSIQYFIDALSDSEVQKQVRRLSPKTLAEAVDLALREESYVTLEKKRPKTQSLSEVEPSDQFSVFSKQLEELRECVAKLSVGKFSADRVEEAAVAPAPIQIPAGNTPNFGNRGGYGNRYRGRGRGNYGRGAQRGDIILLANSMVKTKMEGILIILTKILDLQVSPREMHQPFMEVEIIFLRGCVRSATPNPTIYTRQT